MEKIIGHISAIEQLKRSLAKGMLANAYLFAGPKGVGKRMVAERFVRSAVCKTSESNGFEPCDTCSACAKVGSRNHPDVFFVEPDKGSIKIAQIRELKSQVVFHPLEAKSKIGIIDDADTMNDSAQNSLLKLLEEPPSNTHLILISSLPYRLLPTIRSRCQTLSFQPIDESSVSSFICSKKGLAKDDSDRIARFSGGSIGTAMAIDPEFVDGVLGKIFTIFTRASSADVIEVSHTWSDEPPEKIALILDVMASCYRDAMKFAMTGDASSSIHKETARLFSNIPVTKIDRCIMEIGKAKSGIESNVNKQLMFEQLLFSLTA